MTDPSRLSGNAILQIIHAVIWAGAMLILSYLFRGEAWSRELLLWMIAGFITANCLIMSASSRNSQSDD